MSHRKIKTLIFSEDDELLGIHDSSEMKHFHAMI